MDTTSEEIRGAAIGAAENEIKDAHFSSSVLAASLSLASSSALRFFSKSSSITSPIVDFLRLSSIESF